jgi:hypothetical protein
MPFVYLVERNTGYDTGVISGALVTIGSDLGPAELSNGQKVSKLLIGGFCLAYHHQCLFNRNLSLLQPHWALYWAVLLLAFFPIGLDAGLFWA